MQASPQVSLPIGPIRQAQKFQQLAQAHWRYKSQDRSSLGFFPFFPFYLSDE